MASKKDIVIKIMKSIATERNGQYELPKAFSDLLECSGQVSIRNSTKKGPWKIGVKGIPYLFGCWTDAMWADGVLKDQKGRCVGNIKFSSPSIRNLQDYPKEGKLLRLSSQFGGGEVGNLKAFCQLIRSYEQATGKAPNSILSITDADYLCGSGATRQNVSLTGFKSYNLIFFGAPGTGKSREIEKLRVQNYREMLGDAATPDNAGKPYFEGYERVTFYPTYSYAQFVGSYKPYMAVVDKDGFEPEDNAKRRKVIAYKFVPGPFLRILAEAIKNPDNNYLFIIEEINRANAASVFGDMFQLLDRKPCDDDEGKSEYAITPSEEVSDWLKEQKVPAGDLRIPGNLYIWATMNSADQGVFPLDTAFKRRWDFKYLSLDDKKDNDKIHVACGKEGLCLWGDLRKAINHLLARNHVNEDKHLSAYFVKPDGDNVISRERFQMKVLMYLWEDAARMCRAQIFNEGILTFSNLIEAWGKASCSKVDEKGEPSGEDNPLDTVFRFGTDKTEIIKVWKVEANDGAGGNAGDANPAQEQKGDAAVQQEKMPVQTLEAANPQAVAEGNKEEPAEKKQEVEPANQDPVEPKINGGQE